MLAAGQADVRGDGVAGAGHGDVGEQQAGDALALAGRGGGVVPDAGQVGDQLGDPVLLGRGERAGVLLAGLVVGGLGVAQGAQGGVPVGFEGAGDEPVGGIDGQVAAGQVGVVAGALDVGGAQRVGFGGSLLKLGGDLEGGLDGQRREPSLSSLASSSRSRVTPYSSTAAKVILSMPGAPSLLRTLTHARHSTSLRLTLSYSAWNLRPGSALPARYSACCKARTGSPDTGDPFAAGLA